MINSFLRCEARSGYRSFFPFGNCVMTQLSKVRAISLRVRLAIESVPPCVRPPELDNFPHGACGSSSLLLGAILVDNGYMQFRYVCGERPSQDGTRTVSHAWLTDGELIVDITADQFCDAPEAVIVTSMSSWHKSFEVEQTGVADFRDSLSPGTVHLWAMYKKVCSLLVQEDLGDSGSVRE